MKLTLLAMQAVDYALTEQSSPMIPWYSDGARLFTVKFTRSENEYQKIWTAKSDEHVERETILAGAGTPELFSRVNYLIRGFSNQANDARDLMAILNNYVIAEMKGPNVDSTARGPYPISAVTLSLRYESGLVLHGVELPNDEYDLVGFEQS